MITLKVVMKMLLGACVGAVFMPILLTVLSLGMFPYVALTIPSFGAPAIKLALIAGALLGAFTAPFQEL
jgi:hypothetical protein